MVKRRLYLQILINGRKISVSADRPLSYRDVADMAGFKAPALPSMTVRILGQEGRILHPADSIPVVEGMIFNVADTSQA
jgi:hypothetical protein